MKSENKPKVKYIFKVALFSLLGGPVIWMLIILYLSAPIDGRLLISNMTNGPVYHILVTTTILIPAIILLFGWVEYLRRWSMNYIIRKIFIAIVGVALFVLFPFLVTAISDFNTELLMTLSICYTVALCMAVFIFPAPANKPLPR